MNRKFQDIREKLRKSSGKSGESLTCLLCRIFSLAAASYIISAVCLMLTLQSFTGAFSWQVSHAGAFVLTCCLIFTVECGVFTLCGSPFVSGLIPGIIAPVLCFISHCKLTANGVPLALSDFFLAGELSKIAGYTKIQLSGVTVAAAIILLALFAGLLFLSLKLRKKPGLFYSHVCAFFIAMAYLCSGVLPAEAVGISRTIASQSERMAEMGVISGLYASAVSGAASEPEDYSPDTMENVVSGLEPSPTPGSTQPPAETEDPSVTESPEPEEEIVPNVIFFMAESFFDAASLPNVEFSSDPVPNYHRLAKESTSGKFYSSTYGGGTGLVELEVMSGIGSYFISESDMLSSLPRTELYSQIPSVPRVLKNSGYSTEFIHSYSSELYNRSVNFPLFGFDKLIFEDDFTVPKEISGQYVSDNTLADQIIAEFEENSGGAPQFIYGLSMETHVPYKNGLFEGYQPVTVTSPLLTEEQTGFLQSYITGLYDADMALGKLTDYFAQCGEPVMLVFWGDHRPGLSCGGKSIYELIGAVNSGDTLTWNLDELQEMLSTEYLIWTNYETGDTAPQNVNTSSYFLGAQVLDRLNLPTSRWFNFLSGMSEDFLMCRDRIFIAADGSSAGLPDAGSQGELDTYKSIIYDMIYGDGYITEYVNEYIGDTAGP